MSGYGCFARHYDALTGNVDYPGRAAYFDRLVRRHAPELQGGLLLDLACGTGSLTLALLDLGYEGIGVDASADMLSIALQKTADSGKRPLFLQQSMTGLDLFGTVDVTVCALDSLNHLPDEAALEEAFRKVALFTNPGGLFLFDVNTAYKHRSILADNTFVYELEGLYCVWQNALDRQSDRVDISLDFFQEQADGSYQRASERFSEWVFSHEAIARLLDAHGLTLLGAYGDDSLDPPTETTQRLVYVAQKAQASK